MSDKIGNRKKLIIRNIVVECDPDDTTNPTLDGLVVTIGETDAEFNLQKTSERQWNYDGGVEIIYPLVDGLSILLSSESGEELGRILIGKEDWDEGGNGRSGYTLKRKVPSLPAWGPRSLGIEIKCNLDNSGDYEEYAVIEGSENLENPSQNLQQAMGFPPKEDSGLPARLNDLGNSYQHRFEKTGDMADLAEAIQNKQQAVKLTPEGHSDLPRWLNSLGILYQLCFQKTGNIGDLSVAIQNFQQAVKLTSEGHSDRPGWLQNLGTSYLMHFQRTREMADLVEAIQNLQQAVKFISERHSDLPKLLSYLGVSYRSCFESTGDMADLTKAIQYNLQAVKLTPEGHSDLPAWLINLGNSYQSSFDRTGNMADLREAIQNFQKAVKLTPEGHSNMPRWLGNLGISYQIHFERAGDMADLAQAIQNLEQAIKLTPEGQSPMPKWLSNLGISYLSHFERTGDMADLAKAIQYNLQAVKLTPEGHPDLPNWLNNLAISYQSHFQRTGDITELAKAIQNLKKAVTLTPDGYSGLPARLNNLGNSYLSHFERTGNMAHLMEAIQNFQQAVKLTPEDHSALPQWLSSLGVSYQICFERTGNIADLTEAIHNQQHAVKLTSENQSLMPQLLTNLGNSYQIHFERTGNVADLEKAIYNKQEAVKLTPKGHLNLPSFLNNLGISYLSRFQKTGDMVDLAEVIQNFQQAVKLTPEGHSNLPNWLSNLGISYLSHFQRTDDMEALEEAIQNLQQAVEIAPRGHSLLPSWLRNLGISYQNHFQKTKNIADLTEAIQNFQQAVKLTPEGHSELPARLNSLGMSYLDHFDRTGNMTYLSEAIQNLQQVIKVAPESHLHLPSWLSDLGESYQTKFQKTQNMVDLAEAIQTAQQAVKLTPKNHSLLSSRLSKLGKLYFLQFSSSHNYNSLNQAISHFHLGAISETGPLANRLFAAQSWIQLSKSVSCSPLDLIPAYDLVIHLLTLLTGFDTRINHRYQQLTKFSNAELPLAAAATAISAKQFHKAIEWLEQGRCIVWNQLNQLRSPIEILHSQYPDLAKRLSVISTALENAGLRNNYHINNNSLDEMISSKEDSYHFLKLARERNDLIHTVQNKPDFQDFLQPKKFPDLISVIPSEGLVIIINTYHDQCDALVLCNSKEPFHIPLHISHAHIIKMTGDLHDYLMENQVISRSFLELRAAHITISDKKSVSKISIVLCDLWISLIKPILNALDLFSESTKKKQHIWWYPTGPLAFLPLHAAGIYINGKASPGESLSDFAISSYIPNLSALLSKPNSSKETQGGMLMVSQPSTPHLEKIPSARDEIKKIKQQLSVYGIDHLVLEDEEGTVSEVLQALERFTCIHFACHASQNLKNPLESAFYLHNGPLELLAIIKKNLPHADFAFLSACQTGTGDQNLSEEVVHLAAGMLAAGYRSVVATMWSIPDKFGPAIAEPFYQNLLQSDNGKLNSVNAAEALHNALKSLKDNPEIYKLSDPLLVWVPYIHVGI